MIIDGQIDTFADLGQLESALSNDGFCKEDVEAIMHKNWLRTLEEALPA